MSDKNCLWAVNKKFLSLSTSFFVNDSDGDSHQLIDCDEDYENNYSPEVVNKIYDVM